MNAQPAHGLTKLVLDNESLLRAIKAAPGSSLTELSDSIDRDASNVSKSLKLLEAEGLIDRDPFSLTLGGQAALERLDRAAGAGPPASEDEVELRHDQIDPDPDNARAQSGLEEESIDDFADGIAQKGILQKPGVRQKPDGRWQLVYGERRWRAWGRLIARGEWPADHVERLPIVRGDDAAILEAGLVENLQRSDLNNLEIAEGLLRLHERHGKSVKELARIAGNKTERFVQIALKVAKGASEADKARYSDSETAYRAAKARNETIKRAYTWEDLRDSVTVPKHVTALEKRDRLTLLVAELAWKVLNDPEPFMLDGQASLLTQISIPPGGGHYATADSLGLVVDHRQDGLVFAGVTELAKEWLEAQGFGVDPDGWLRELRLEFLGDLGEELRRRGDTFGTTFLKPPRPAPPSVTPPPPPTVDPIVADHAEMLQQVTAPLPPPRDDFAAAIREVNERPQEVPASLTSDAARDQALEAAKPEASGPSLTSLELVALVELAHKITVEGVEARGGALRGARIGNFSSGPGAKEANGLMLKRLVGYIQAPGGTGFLGHLTQAAWDLVGRVDMARVEEVHFEDLPDGAVVPEGRTYYTDWLTVPEGAKPEKHEAPPPARDPAPEPVIDPAAVLLGQIQEKLQIVAADANGHLFSMPNWLPSTTHAWRIADRAVRALAYGDMGLALAEYARLFSTLGLSGAKDELAKSFARVGLTVKSAEMAFSPDSPTFADLHRNCHGTVSTDADGDAIITPDPRAPALEEDGE